MNFQRIGGSLSVSRLCVGILCVCILYVVGASFGQQLPVEIIEPNPIGTLPQAGTLPQGLSDETKNDPLYQEIQRIVLQGVHSDNNGQALGRASAQIPKDSAIDSISNARWHAVESILAAARLLEKDFLECVRRGDVESASKLQVTIKNLRRQAMELLR